MLRRTVMTAVIAMLAACETTSTAPAAVSHPSPEAVFLAVSDPGYHLSERDRARLPEALDADAVEALLARMRPEYRTDVIESLAELATMGPISFDLVQPVGIADPGIVALFANLPKRMNAPRPR